MSLSILTAQTPPDPSLNSEPPRIHLKDDLCCFLLVSATPIYPREARLARTEGVVKLHVVFAKTGTVKGVETISGESPFVEAALKAVRQWRIQPVLLNGEPQESDVSLTYKFSIEEPPKPAYLHLTDERILRVDTVREFTDRVEYTTGRTTHRIAAEKVRGITACGYDCIPGGGGTSLNIRAIPLLASDKDSNATVH